MLFDVEFPPVTGPPVASPPIDPCPVADPPVTGPPVAEPPVAPGPVADPPVTGPPMASPPCCACILDKDTSIENRTIENAINEIVIILVNKVFTTAGLSLDVKSFSSYPLSHINILYEFKLKLVSIKLI